MVFWENMSNSGAKIGGFSNFLGNSPKLRTFEAIVTRYELKKIVTRSTSK